MSVTVVSWNIATRIKPWRELVAMDADVALLQEAIPPPDYVVGQRDAALPGATVDRASFLESQLISHCPREQVAQAIRGRPAAAGISPDLIDSLADSSTKSHVFKASSISFATGLPGGWAMAATIPADLAQFGCGLPASVACLELAIVPTRSQGW